MLLRTWRTRRAAYQLDAATAYLHDRARFRSLLECERMRADRSKSKFSLVTFAFADSDAGRTGLRAFAEQLQPRIRATDHAGFVEPSQIGVILWDTGEVGAWKFVDSLLQVDGIPRPNHLKVYVYPTHEAPPKDGGKTSPVATELLSEVSRECGEARPVEPLELLFLRKLPWWKRSIDVVGAGAGLLLLSPLLAAVALLIKLSSRGPVLFVQLRDGLGGRPFRIFKFRTMCVDAEARKAALRAQSEQDGPAFKMKHDPRVTRLGRFLRKSCIDELPQLLNVLRGDMTLVGPRPLPIEEARQIDGWKRRRLEVTPGLTCIWQVHGKSKVPFTEWMRMDIRYLRARTFWRDMKLVFQTLAAVLMHRASS